MKKNEIIQCLHLEPHPEGGWFRRIYESGVRAENSSYRTGSSIYYLMGCGEVSRLHTISSDEIWAWHGGAPVRMYFLEGQQGAYRLRAEILGMDLAAGQRPQILAPANTIFGAVPMEGEDYALISCFVTPEFSYDEYRLFTIAEAQALCDGLGSEEKELLKELLEEK